MGKLLQHYCWNKTQPGDPGGWSETLKNSLSLTLNSRITAMFRGQDHISDACLPIPDIDGKHPGALGKTAAGGLPEAWPAVKPVIDPVVRSEGRSICHNDGFFSVYCNKVVEDASPAFCYAPIYGKEGAPPGVLVPSTETTTWVRTIRNLENYGKQFQNLVRQVPVGMILLIGEELRVEVVNEMYGRLIGRMPEELLNKKLFDVIPEAEKDLRPVLETVRLSQAPLYRYGEPYFVHTKAKKIGGFLDLVYQPYRESSDGTISGVMILCHDVTDQVKKRKKTEAEEAKARLAIESAELGTYEMNLRTQEIKTSERFNAILRVENGVSKGQLASLIHPDDREVMVALPFVRQPIYAICQQNPFAL